MRHTTQPHSTPLASRPALTGCWTLQAGHAVTLRPREASVLRVRHGRVWATLSSAPVDHLLVDGASLQVPVGDRVVLEPWPVQRAAPVYFDWDPMPVLCAACDPAVTLEPACAPAATQLRFLAAGWRALAGRFAGGLRALSAASSARRAHDAMC